LTPGEKLTKVGQVVAGKPGTTIRSKGRVLGRKSAADPERDLTKEVRKSKVGRVASGCGWLVVAWCVVDV